MKWRILFLAACITFAGLSAHAATAKGVVFHDANGNQVRDAGEAGIPDVLVSNGEKVVKTNAEGKYRLPVGNDTILFVCKPEGWMTPVDENNVPRFYYIHKPKGSPDLKYKGVAPTGPLPKSVDFPLTPHPEPEQFTALFFGDTQVKNQTEVDYTSHDMLEELVGVNAAFGVTLGDIVDEDLSVMEGMRDAMGQIGVPWYYVIGNHDENFDVSNDALSDETFERLFGPANYAFQYGKVHFIALDNIVWTGKDYHGGFNGQQLAFVQNYLAYVPKNERIVMMMHIPLSDVPDAPKLLALLDGRPSFTASAHAHLQLHLFLGEEPNAHHLWVAPTACGMWWNGAKDERGIPHATICDGSPNGYSFVSFNGADYAIRFKASSRPADYQMNIYAPDTVERDKLGETPLLANIFAGSKRSKVEYRLDGKGDWTPMEWVEGLADPAYVRMKELEQKMDESIGHESWEPFPNVRHMWRANLPGNIASGTHCIEVRTTDMFGQVFTGYRVMAVE